MDRLVGVWMDGQMDRLVDGCVTEQTYSKMSLQTLSSGHMGGHHTILPYFLYVLHSS